MCGRYTFFNNIDSLKHSLDIDVIDENIFDHQASYNIAPTQQAPIIFQDNNKRILNSANDESLVEVLLENNANN